jgi:hypothetical protein
VAWVPQLRRKKPLLVAKSMDFRGNRNSTVEPVLP